MNLNWDSIRGSWNQLKGEVRQQWGKLTDDDMAELKGNRDELVGKVQKRYGLTREAAERQVDEWGRKHQDIHQA